MLIIVIACVVIVLGTMIVLGQKNEIKYFQARHKSILDDYNELVNRLEKADVGITKLLKEETQTGKRA